MSLKQKIAVNTIWSIGGQAGISLIQLIANIIYARFLSPEEFGRVGIVMFFVLFSYVLIEGGLGGALVRKIDASEKDFSTVFIFNFLVSIFLYLLLFFSAGFIANFYGDPELNLILKVIGIILIVNSLNFTQNTRLVKALEFKKLTKYKLTAVMLAHVIGVILAFYHFRVWALVVAILSYPTILAIIFWVKEGDLGSFQFSKKSFKGLYRFGLNTSLASIIDTAFNNIYQLIIGKYFSISEVGLFFQAKKLQEIPNYIISSATNSVIFSGLARLQDDREKFLFIYNKIINYFSILIGLITLYILVYANEIIQILYGNKWEGAGIYLMFLAAGSFFYVHEVFNRVVFKTFDRTKLILQLELVKKSILVISIVIGIAVLNIRVLLTGFIIVSMISYVINFFVSRKIVGSDAVEEFFRLFKIILAISVCYLIMYVLKNVFEFNYLILILTIPLITLVYFIILYLLKIKVVKEELIQFIHLDF